MMGIEHIILIAFWFLLLGPLMVKTSDMSYKDSFIVSLGVTAFCLSAGTITLAVIWAIIEVIT